MAWAVIFTLTGAIVTDAENRLLMKLSREDADRIAAELDDASPDRAETAKR